MVAPVVTFHGDELRVRFDSFDLAAYSLFLAVKKIPEQRTSFDPADETYTVTAPARFAELLGVTRPAPDKPDLPLSPFLYDDQAFIVRSWLDAKRFSVWSNCGLGKTLVTLEVGRHVTHRTGGRFMVVTINEVVNEWLTQARQFYGDTFPVVRLRTGEEMREWCRAGTIEGVPTAAKFAITNYEKFNHKGPQQIIPELRHLAGLALDENRIKTGGGVQKWSLIKSAKGIEYKGTLTATPAPNNAMEFASHASFLEKMRTETEVIWTFFRRNPDTGEWDLRPHARAAFFEWMATWSIYVRDPKRYGWRLTLPDVPPPEYHRVDIDPTPEQLAAVEKLKAKATRKVKAEQGDQPTLFDTRNTNTIDRVKLSEVAKGFLYGKRAGKRIVRRIPTNKPATVAGIVAREQGAGGRVLVWTVFDGESLILGEHLRDLGVPFEKLTGSTAPTERTNILDRFRSGETSVLLSRPQLLGYGMNLQFIDAMVFSGWTDSYEQFYQAVRRGSRWGRSTNLRVYLPYVVGLEDETLANLDAKASRTEAEIDQMETQYVRVLGRAG